MKILVACEESQAITNELRKLGHNAYSCDLIDCSGGNPQWHIKGDAVNIAYNTGFDWEMMIAHPPCTYLSVSGARWMYHPDDKHLKTEDRRPHPSHPDRKRQQRMGLDFVKRLMDAPIEKIAIENPVSVISSKIRKPDQIIQPFHFGDPHRKTTCLWLKNLPLLAHTNVVEPDFVIGKDGKKYSMIHYMSQWKEKAERARLRSKTFPGIAKAIAAQWTTPTCKEK